MATGSNIKTPPILRDDSNYTEWKWDLSVWELYTDLEEKKRGPAVILSLDGIAKEACRSIPPADLGKDGGVKLITDKLDGILLKDVNTRVFLAFKDFYDYKRPSGASITEFLIRYEYLYQKLTVHNITLPEGVQAFFLLTAANISEDKERLARTTCPDMTKDGMKLTIQKIFGDPASAENKGSVAIKQEPAFMTSEQEEEAYWTRNSYNNRGRGRGYYSRGQNNRGRPWQRKDNNHKNRSGNPQGMKCFKCGSKSHFIKDCPAEECHFTLLSTRIKPSKPLSSLLRETLGMAILDSACSKTVCGRAWKDAYLEQLSDSDRALVKETSTNTKFKFGDGAECVSKSLVKLPVVIGNVKGSIETNVVENEIPMLLSQKSLKSAGCNLDFTTDTATLLGQNIKLTKTNTGHYCVPLSKYILGPTSDTKIVLHTNCLEGLTIPQKKQKALKLHKQFSHASKEKLCKLVKESNGFNDSEFLEILSKCCEDCELCQKFKRPPLRPVVSIPLADNFNQVVCMDLKEHVHNKSWVLHLIDSFSRYSAACIIYSKAQDVIINKIFLIWIAYFGAPCSFLSDNGGEFSNHSFREMNEKLNVQTCTTAGESPFSNGVVERHNSVLYETMSKTMLEAKVDDHTALAWAVSSKNALQNQGGFSPNQLVFGFNPNMPSVLFDKPPALDQSEVDVIRKHLNAYHSSREAFVRSEHDERIRRALRHKLRTYSDTRYSNGDRVYYIRQHMKGWKGPATVIGQDGQFVAIRHGGEYYRCHPSQLMMVKGISYSKDDTENDASKRVLVAPVDKRVIPSLDDDEDSGGSINIEENTLADSSEEIVNNRDTEGDTVEKLRDKPARGSFVKYKLNGEIDWTHAEVLNKQPKQSGRYKNWVNLHVIGAPKGVCINWDCVDDWEMVHDENIPPPVNENMVPPIVVDENAVPHENVVPPPDDLPPLVDENSIDTLICEEALVTLADKSAVKEAKQKEISNLLHHDVFQIVPYTGQKTVSSKWVLGEKIKNGASIIKARLVAKGFEEDSSNLVKDSPTCTRESMRLLYLTSSLMSWKLQSMDISSAFLQGWPLEREVYLQPPPDVCSSDQCWRLKRCIYGLNDAPRKWYNKVFDVLINLGAKVSIYDNAFFLWHNENGQLYGLVACHVDDFLFCGSDKFGSIIDTVKSTFLISSHEISDFKYLGLNVHQSPVGIKIDQDRYCQEIKPIKLSLGRVSNANGVLNCDERKELKRLSGQMLWVTSQTRPDMSFETCMMSNMGKEPTVRKIIEANKALAKLQSRKSSIKFPNLGDPSKLRVVSYSDATYASLPDGSSQGGVITFVEGSNGKVAPISWCSKRLNRVTKSPLASETLAVNEGADEGFFVSSMLQEIFRLPRRPQVHCVTDNASLYQNLETSNPVTDKRLRVDVARLREMIREEVVLKWVPGKLQVADALTKRGASSVVLMEVLELSMLPH